MTVEIKLKHKYRVSKQGKSQKSPAGNSGNKKKKRGNPTKGQYLPPPPTLYMEAGTGRARWIPHDQNLPNA